MVQVFLVAMKIKQSIKKKKKIFFKTNLPLFLRYKCAVYVPLLDALVVLHERVVVVVELLVDLQVVLLFLLVY
jgi:hypothetical protein